VQKLLVAALRQDSALAVLVQGIFDGVPAAAQFPYVTLGPDLTSDWSSKTSRGHEHRVSLSVWDEAAGTARAKSVLAAIEDAVRQLAGAIDAHQIVSVLFLRSFVTKNPDGATQGVIEFRIRSAAI
ncbi:MAG: DUF3168 domain-containing protein, partial [Polymorphobacter sp.]